MSKHPAIQHVKDNPGHTVVWRDGNLRCLNCDWTAKSKARIPVPSKTKKGG